MPSPPLLGRRLTRFVPSSALENINKMLLQFEGREDELIETLRTIHEWKVAQRARADVQKTAKLEARANASGATAALLADYGAPNRSASGSHSAFLSSEALSTPSTAFSMSSDSVGRVQELDQMVIGGDWGGIMLAAAQFEGGTPPQDDDTTGTEDAIATGSRNREAVRGAVERLVRRVVPDDVGECPARKFRCRVRRFWDGA